MKNRLITIISLLLLIVLTSTFFVGCSKKENEPEYVTITFLDWDGKIIQANKVPKGKTPTAPTGLERQTENGIQYTFKGWDKDFNEPQEDITVTAVYESSKRFQIYFIVDNETIFTAIAGEVFSVPTPTKEGYLFEGWYNDIELTEKADVNYVYYRYVNNDVYLYAKMILAE